MGRYTMFLDWKNQHCEHVYTTLSNLHIQCNPNQTTNGIFHRTRTKNFTICREKQKTPNSQSNLEKENRKWRHQAPRFQTIVQSYSNQDCMGRAGTPGSGSLPSTVTELPWSPRGGRPHWGCQLWRGPAAEAATVMGTAGRKQENRRRLTKMAE